MNKRNEYGKRAPVEERCLDHVRRALGGLAVTYEPAAPEGRVPYDGVLEVRTQPPTRLRTLVRPRKLDRALIQHLLALTAVARKKAAAPAAILCRYVPEDAARLLREEGIAFADTLGNLHLQAPGVRLWEVGNRPPREREGEPRRLTDPAALRLINAYINEPGTLGQPYRKTAQDYGIGLATITAVKGALLREGFMNRTGRREWKLARIPELVERFVQGYAAKLRPRLFIGRFRAREKNLDDALAALARIAQDRGIDWAVTGEYAAKEMTRYLRPGHLTVFTDDRWEQAHDQAGLAKDREGPVTLLRIFPGAKGKPGNKWPMANRLMVYAELIHEADGRTIETGRMLLEKYLKDLERVHG